MTAAAAKMTDTSRRTVAGFVVAMLMLLGLIADGGAAEQLRVDLPPALVPVLGQPTYWHSFDGRVIRQTFRAPAERISHLELFPRDDESGFTGGVRVSVYVAGAEGEPTGNALFSHLLSNAEWRAAAGESLRLPLLLHGLEPDAEYVLQVETALPSQTEAFNRRLPPTASPGLFDRIYDFGSEGSSQVPRTIPVTDQVYAPGRAFGWNRVTRGRGRHTYDPLVIADALMRDAVIGNAGSGKNRRTFTVRAPNGRYRVALLLGDPWEYGGGVELGNITVRCGDQVIVDRLHLPRKTYQVYEAAVEAVDETLAFTFESDGEHGGWAIMALRITAADLAPDASTVVRLGGFRRVAFDGTLSIDGALEPDSHAVALRLYSFAETVAPAVGNVALCDAKALTGMTVEIDAEGKARYAYRGVGRLELDRPEERLYRYIADAKRIQNVVFTKKHGWHGTNRNGGFDANILLYDLASLRPDLGPLALRYEGGAAGQGVQVSVSDDGETWQTLARNAFGQVHVFQKRYLRFQFDYGRSNPTYSHLTDFRLWSWTPVSVPGLADAIRDLDAKAPNPVSAASGPRPALVRLDPARPPTQPPLDGPRAIQRHFPLGLAFPYEARGRYAKPMGIEIADFLPKLFDDLAAHHLNTLYINNCSTRDAHFPLLLDLAEKHDVRLLPMLGDIMVRYHSRHRGSGHYRFDRFRVNAAAATAELRSRRGLLAYLVEEECPWPEEMRRYSDIVREYDPSHAVLNLQMVYGNRAIVDQNNRLPVLFTDIYPRQNYHLQRGWLEDHLEENVALADSIGAHFWYMAQCQTADRPRLPDPGEVRLMPWLGIAHGAKGVLFWSYSALRRVTHFTATPQWRAIGELFATLKPISPLLLDCRRDPLPTAFAAAEAQTDVGALFLPTASARLAVVTNCRTDRPADVEVCVTDDTPAVFDLLTLDEYPLAEPENHTRCFTARLGPGCGTVVLLGTLEQFDTVRQHYSLPGNSNLSPANRDDSWEAAVAEFMKQKLQPAADQDGVRVETDNATAQLLTSPEDAAVYVRVSNQGEAREIAFRLLTDRAGDIYSFSTLRETMAEKEADADGALYRVYFEKNAATLFMLPEKPYDFFELLDESF